MGWLKAFTNATDELIDSLPRHVRALLFVCIGLSGSAVISTIGYNFAHSYIDETLPATEERLQAARNRLEIARLKAAEGNAFIFELDKNSMQRQIEQDKVRANQKNLGLEPALASSHSEAVGVAQLAALGDVISKNLLTIVAIGVLILVYNTFSSNCEHWRLVLHIALLLVLAGGAALWQGIAIETTAEMEYKDFFASVNSGSVGLYLMLFGTFLSAYALHVLRKPDILEKPLVEK